MKPIKKSPVITWITGLSYISKEKYFYNKYNLYIIPIPFQGKLRFHRASILVLLEYSVSHWPLVKTDFFQSLTSSMISDEICPMA